MLIEMLKAKIHRVTVTQAELNYVGSITIDEDLLKASGIRINEKVSVVNVNNGERFETYTIKGEAGSGLVERLVCTHTNLKLEQRLELYETVSSRRIPWDIEMTVEAEKDPD